MKVTFTPVAPYRLDYTASALRRRTKNCIDIWDGKYYARLLKVNNKPVKVVVEQPNYNKPKLIGLIEGADDSVTLKHTKSIVSMMLGLKVDLTGFYEMARHDVNLNPLVLRFMGVKPPRFPTIFEALINAISCQQISLDAGLEIQNRLVQHININTNHNNHILYAFPDPKDVCSCSISELKNIGYSTKKSVTILNLTTLLKEKQIDFNDFENKTNNEIIEFLCQFKGIGRWTAEYVLLRGLGRIEIFPRDDIGAQNNLQKLLNLNFKPDDKSTSDITSLWTPYAGMVYFHLLLQKISEKGVL